MPTPPNTLQIILGPPESPTEPPHVATAVAIHFLSDLVVLSFGHPNLFDAATNGQLHATTFSQVALPRSSFAGFLQSAITVISDLPDRDAFGWPVLKELLAKSPAK